MGLALPLAQVPSAARHTSSLCRYRGSLTSTGWHGCRSKGISPRSTSENLLADQCSHRLQGMLQHIQDPAGIFQSSSNRLHHSLCRSRSDPGGTTPNTLDLFHTPLLLHISRHCGSLTGRRHPDKSDPGCRSHLSKGIPLPALRTWNQCSFPLGSTLNRCRISLRIGLQCIFLASPKPRPLHQSGFLMGTARQRDNRKRMPCRC